MNLDFYRNYIAIVESGSLSAAARKLHIAQSALSMQLRQFEDEYSAELFRRNSRHMEITDAGRILYEKARRMITLLDDSYKEISACVGGSQGTVAIGVTQAYPDREITNLLISFQRENPGLCYEFYEVNSGEIMDLLRTGVVEIGIVRTSGALPGFLEKRISFRQQLCAYCSNDNPWIPSDRQAIPLSALDHVPIAISRGFTSLLKDVFERAGVEPTIKSISTSRSNPMMWAKASAAIAIICTNEAEMEGDAEAFCRPLCSSDPTINIMLQTVRSFITVKDRTLSPAAQRFLNFSSQYFAGSAL